MGIFGAEWQYSGLNGVDNSASIPKGMNDLVESAALEYHQVGVQEGWQTGEKTTSTSLGHMSGVDHRRQQ